jgi:NTE family protein
MRVALAVSFIYFCLFSNAQSKPTALVMEGGGVKAFAYVGAINILDSAGQFSDLRYIGGTSGGAIMACLYALGCTAQELDSIAHHIPVKKFADGGSIFTSKFRRVNNQYGFYKGDAFAKWLGEIVAAKTGNANINFENFLAFTQARKLPRLFITATDLSTQSAVVLSNKTFPKMRIVDAVRISISIPMVYKAMFVDADGRCFTKFNAKDSMHVMVDGGLLYNYPIHMFDSAQFIAGAAGNDYQYNTAVLGLKIDTEDFAMPKGVYYNIDNLRNYGNAIYHTVIDKPTNEIADLQRTIIIELPNMSGRVRKLPKSTVELMLQQGRKAAYHHLGQLVK